jgi:hypothetical protein
LPLFNIEQSLASLELHWLEKLQPFGESGYNSVKAYKRDLSRLQNPDKKGQTHPGDISVSSRQPL